jgi:hypothetical protein
MLNRATLARLALGLTFVLFGFDGLFHFFPLPPLPEAASAVIATLAGYRLFYVVKAVEVTAGALLLWGRFELLALTLLGPVLFNITWFDLNLDPRSLPVALGLSALEGALLWRHRAALRPLWQSSLSARPALGPAETPTGAPTPHTAPAPAPARGAARPPQR